MARPEWSQKARIEKDKLKISAPLCILSGRTCSDPGKVAGLEGSRQRRKGHLVFRYTHLYPWILYCVPVFLTENCNFKVNSAFGNYGEGFLR